MFFVITCVFQNEFVCCENGLLSSGVACILFEHMCVLIGFVAFSLKAIMLSFRKKIIPTKHK